MTAAVITVAVFLFYTSYYYLRGGLSTLDTNCGAFFINAASITTSPNWYNGAALSFVTSYYARRGGRNDIGNGCGAFFVDGNIENYMYGWSICAAL